MRRRSNSGHCIASEKTNVVAYKKIVERLISHDINPDDVPKIIGAFIRPRPGSTQCASHATRPQPALRPHCRYAVARFTAKIY